MITRKTSCDKWTITRLYGKILVNIGIWILVTEYKHMDLKHKIKLALPLILYGVFYIVSFKLLEGIEWDHYITPYVAIDHMIPFVPAFVIPYLAWFVWVPFVLVVLLFEDEKEFIRSSHMLMIGMTLFLLFSAFIPTRLFIRPYADPNGGFFMFLLSCLYGADTPTNVFPSIHVYNTCATLYSILISKAELFQRKWFRIFAIILTILICLSTMFIKQHSIIDVIGAIVMFFIVAALIQEYHKKHDKADNAAEMKQ